MQRARGKILRDQSDHAESKRENIKGSERSSESKREQARNASTCIYITMIYLLFHVVVLIQALF